MSDRRVTARIKELIDRQSLMKSWYWNDSQRFITNWWHNIFKACKIINDILFVVWEAGCRADMLTGSSRQNETFSMHDMLLRIVTLNGPVSLRIKRQRKP
jgi:hypothetical protein